MYPHDTGNIKEQKWLTLTLTLTLPLTQAYIKEQKWLDSVFDKYDTNKSGQLEKGQLIELLRRVSPGVEVSDADEAYVLDMVDLSNTGRSPLGTAHHAPLSTLHSLPAFRLTTYYSPLTTYHVLRTTAASSAPRLSRRARPGRASSRRATYLARRPPCARCYNADRASGDGGMCRDVEKCARHNV